MEFFKTQTNIDFMGARYITGALSIILVLVSSIGIYRYGINFSLEFTGGLQMHVAFDKPFEIEDVRKILHNAGYADLKLQRGAKLDLAISMGKMQGKENEVGPKVAKIFQDSGYNLEIKQVEFVGAEVGEQLMQEGSMAVLVAILATMIYIALRFEYRFALSAALALLHDIFAVLGIFALFKIEFDLATLAALMAVLGYSLNDTIVVFDRVRENFRKLRKKSTMSIMNISINQTLSRTIMTSWMTLLVVIALLLFGGKTLFGFSLALFIGIIIGTYSSIYVAGACALALGLSRADLLPKPRIELDDMP